MGKRNWSSQRHPAVSAAFSREMPERLTGEPEQKPHREPMSDEELKAWSEVQAEKFGIHAQGAEAAKRGGTLMVFLQAESKSVPYDEYKAHLDNGGLPIGEPKPVPRQLATNGAGRLGTKSELDLVARHGVHGEDLVELLENMREITGGQPGDYPQITAHSPSAIGQPDIPQPGAEAA